MTATLCAQGGGRRLQRLHDPYQWSQFRVLGGCIERLAQGAVVGRARFREELQADVGDVGVDAAAVGVVGLVGTAKLVPEMSRVEGVPLRHELAAFKNAQVLLAMAMTVLGFGGVFAAITYIAPMMTHAAGFADGAVIWLLVFPGSAWLAATSSAASMRTEP